MSNAVTNSAEALIKLQVRLGNLGFFLSATELGLIETACGVVAEAGVLTTPGPAATVVATIEGPWHWAAGQVVAISVDIDQAASPTVVSVTTSGGKQTTSDVCALLAAAISEVVGATATSVGGATINESVITAVVSGGATDITLSSFSVT